MRQTEEIAVRVGLAVLFVTATIAAPSTARDPWSEVPAFPAGYYASLDDFSTKLAAAKDAVSKECDRQDKLNEDLMSRVKALGPAEMQTRLQSFMMENPEEAMKMMQQNQAVGETFTEIQLKAEATRQTKDGELKDLQARYQSALDNARAPYDAKFKELDARAQKALVPFGEGWTYAPWAVKEYDGIVAQWNTASEKIFGEWWSASGRFRSWLTGYREYLIKDVIPSREAADNVAAGFMVHLLDTPDATFKSTATLDAVRGYLKQVSDVFGQRPLEPRKPFVAGL